MTVSEATLAREAIDRIDETLGLVLADLPRPGDWAAHGACRTAPPSLFFISRGDDANPAKKICAKCGVRKACIEYAVNAGSDLRGIWGGTSEKQRRIMRREIANPDVDEPDDVPVAAPKRQISEPNALFHTLTALTEHPGRWAKVAHWPSKHSAQSIASLLRTGKKPTPAGRWVFEGRLNDELGGSDLYALFEGLDALGVA